MTPNQDPAASRLLLDLPEVSRITSLSRRTVWRLCSAGDFPRPVRVPGIRAARWKAADVAEWVEQLAEAEL